MNYQTQYLIYHAQPYQIITYLQAIVTYFNVLITFDVRLIVSFTINFVRGKALLALPLKRQNCKFCVESDVTTVTSVSNLLLNYVHIVTNASIVSNGIL